MVVLRTTKKVVATPRVSDPKGKNTMIAMKSKTIISVKMLVVVAMLSYFSRKLTLSPIIKIKKREKHFEKQILLLFSAIFIV